ncbi:MAG: Yip1 family protein [Caulobacteraceae bacterium]
MTTEPTGAASSGLIDRIKNILLTPQAEWDRISSEPADVNKIYLGYVLPLAAFAALCGFIGMTLIGVLGWRVGIVPGLIGAVIQTAMGLVSVFVIAFIANALAPTFGSRQDMGQAHKLAGYGCTAFFVAGVFAIFPPLAILAIVGLYSFALIYIGLPRIMGTPVDKRIGYLATIIIIAIVVGIVLNVIVTQVLLMVPGYRPPNPFGF